MMKFVAFLALVLVAVSAKNHFKQPKMSCAYKLNVKVYEDGKWSGEDMVEFNGRYFKIVSKREETFLGLLRPDIGGEDNLTVFSHERSECEVEEVTMDDFKYVSEMYSNLFWLYVNDQDWDHKKDEKFKDKKCVHYYNDKNDEGSIYVYDDYIYAVVYDDKNYYTLEYEWKAPMEDFVLSKKDYPKCYDKEKKVADEPSEDYIMCAASSVKIAFVAMVAALLAALF